MAVSGYMRFNPSFLSVIGIQAPACDAKGLSRRTPEKGGVMISSPCKNCPKRNQSKEDCSKDCELLQKIQGFQVTAKGDAYSQAIDYSEECRYVITTLPAEASIGF
jgi:hypothetical protein